MSTNLGGVTPPNIREAKKRPSQARPLKNFSKAKNSLPSSATVATKTTQIS
jgi:hypothetical protein